MVNVQDFIAGAQNITSESELIEYASKEIFLMPVVVIYAITLLIMLVLGMTIINRDKSNFYAIFIFSLIILGSLLFFTFYFPILPQAISKMIGGIF